MAGIMLIVAVLLLFVVVGISVFGGDDGSTEE